ncbi:MAG: hypothetical protein M3N30_02900, partial [Bacteroidota bacterium]|nr:hypothetical protein [Bacteroidota bacterium]
MASDIAENLSNVWPRQDIPENERTPQWFRRCIDYAIYHYNSNRKKQIEKINRLYKSYNGVVDERSFSFLNRTYGADNVSKYIDYRLPRTTVDIVFGEWISRPLNSTVYTINKDSLAKKYESYIAQLALSSAPDHVDKLRNVVGVDVFNGMMPPLNKEGEIVANKNIKTKNEIYMQILLDKQVKNNRFRSRLSQNMYDTLIAAECFGKCDINQFNKPEFFDIDPRDPIFEEIDRDPFLEKSPYLGCRRVLFLHDILSQYKLTQEERNKLYTTANTVSERGGQDLNGNRNFYHILNGQLAFEVYH